MNRFAAFLVFFAASAYWMVRADEGRIPIATPTTITEPGHYIVTRDITVSSGSVVTIQASKVTLDLNGRTLTRSGGTDPVIQIANDSHDIKVLNGRLIGGGYGISTGEIFTEVTLDLESLQVIDPSFLGIYISSTAAIAITVVGCNIRTAGNGGIFVGSGGASTTVTGRFVDNLIEDTGNDAIVVYSARNVEVRGNVMRNVLAGVDVQGFITGRGGNRVIGNTISGRVGAGGFGISVGGLSSGGQCTGNVVKDNEVVDFARGIQITADETEVSDNRVSGMVQLASGLGDGVHVFGSRNLVQRNLVENNAGCGIRFANANAHAYRDNMLRGNTGGAVCGSANTDAGGNIP